MNKPAVCVASNRSDSLKRWWHEWREHFRWHKACVFIMHDSEDREATKKLDFCMDDKGPAVLVFDHVDVAAELKDKRWIIPTRTSACKSFAIYKAWQCGYDPIMVLDDDCYPQTEHDWLGMHISNLQSHVSNIMFWTTDRVRPRGIPYLPNVPVMLSHGLWLGNPDVDAVTALSMGNEKPALRDQVIPRGCLFPMSGMNIAFRREIAPLMYFGLHGPSWGVDRFDDIWCGMMTKKVLDLCNMAATSGRPNIKHIRASDPMTNLAKEAPGYKMNIELFEWLNRLHMMPQNGTKPTTILGAIAEAMNDWATEGSYWQSYSQALITWLDLFGDEPNGRAGD